MSMTRISKRTFLALSVAWAAGYCATAVHADTSATVWQDAQADWSAAGSWDASGPPSTTVSAVFDTATGYTNQPTLSADSTSEGIWVSGDSGGVTTTISGAHALTVTGDATLDSNASTGILLDGLGNNNLTIDATVSSVTISKSTSFSVNNGGTLTIDSGLTTGANTLMLGGTGTGSTIINGDITGNLTGSGSLGTIQYQGTANVTLNGDNTNFTGTFIVGPNLKGDKSPSGTLTISTDTALGSGTVELYNSNNNADYATLATAANDLILSNNFKIGDNTGNTVSQLSVIAGVGSLTINGTFTNGSDPTGSLENNIATGKALIINGDFVSGSGTSLTIIGTGETIINGAISGTAILAYAGSGDLTINGGFSNTDGLQVGTGTSNGTVTLGATGTTLITMASGSSTMGPLTSLQASTPLTGANALTGPVKINASAPVASFAGSNAMTFTGAVSVGKVNAMTFFNNMTGGATLTFSGNTLTHVAAATNNTAITFAGTGNTVMGDDINLLNPGTDNFSVVMSGPGTLTLSGDNTYTGGTVITGGTLVAASTTALGAGDVNVNGGTLEIDPPVDIGAGSFTLTAGDSGTLKLDLAADDTNSLTGTGTYTLGDSTTVDLGIGTDPSFDYGSKYDILMFTTPGVVGNISITDYDTADWVASIADDGNGNAVLSFTAPVPEPASLALLGLAGLPLFFRRRRNLRCD